MDAITPDPDNPIPALKILEPSPVDETPTEGYNEYFPPQPPPTRLGLTSHHLPYYLHRAQKYSSLAFTIFTAMHITNTSVIPLLSRSLPSATSYLLLTRPYYQSALAEPLLVALPLATHIISGIALRLHRRSALLTRYADSATRTGKRSARATTPWPPLSWPAVLGYVAVPLVLGHAAITRGLPRAVDGSSAGIGLDYVGHGVAMAPVMGFVGFTALVGVVSTHVVWGIARWAGYTPDLVGTGRSEAQRRLERKRRWWLLQGGSLGVAVVWAAGGLGFVCRGGRVAGWVGRAYDEILARVPLLKWAF